MAKQNIVVVEAGYAGVSATKYLIEKLKKEDIAITLVDCHSYHTMMTELCEVAGGRVEPEAIQHDLRHLFTHQKNVQPATDTVAGIDREQEIVRTKLDSYPFGQLILGMDGEPNDFGTSGIKAHGLTLWSLEDFVRIRKHIEKTVAKTALEPDDELRKAMLTFTVCDSRFAGIEMTGELIDWKDRPVKDYRLDPDEIILMIVGAMPTILNMLDRNDTVKTEHYLRKHNVGLLLNTPIIKVAADYIRLRDGCNVLIYTLIWAAGAKGTFGAADFGLEPARRQWLAADEYMQAKSYGDKNIYIIDDSTFYEEFPGTPTPQIIQAAEQTEHATAASIVASIKGGEKRKSKRNYQGLMVSIDAKQGVTNLFGRVHLSGSLAIVMKHIVNLKYFLGIRSSYYTFQYLMHEFFHIKDDRSVTQGYSSRYGDVLWSVSPRIFYGLVWLVEASKKIVGDGEVFKPNTWFGEESWFTGNSVFPWMWEYNIVDVASNASAAGDAITTAGGAGTSAGEVATQAVHFGLSYVYGEEPMTAIEKSPDWFAEIMQMIISNNDAAIFLRKFMVFLEIALTLVLAVGLFTWLCNATTAVLVITLCLSGMFYWANIWSIFVVFALTSGSGRMVGLDRWVIL